MIWKKILLLVMASVCGMSEAGMTFCQAGENCTINLVSLTKTDVSPDNIDCRFLPNTQGTSYKIFYRIKNDTDKQFAGRVQFDKKELKEGRLTFHLFNATTNDSGTYLCYLSPKSTTKSFVFLIVNQTNDGENNNTTPSNSGMVALKGTTPPSEDQNSSTKYYLSGFGVIFLLLTPLAALILVVAERRQQGRGV